LQLPNQGRWHILGRHELLLQLSMQAPKLFDFCTKAASVFLKLPELRFGTSVRLLLSVQHVPQSCLLAPNNFQLLLESNDLLPGNLEELYLFSGFRQLPSFCRKSLFCCPGILPCLVRTPFSLCCLGKQPVLQSLVMVANARHLDLFPVQAELRLSKFLALGRHGRLGSHFGRFPRLFRALCQLCRGCGIPLLSKS